MSRRGREGENQCKGRQLGTSSPRSPEEHPGHKSRTVAVLVLPFFGLVIWSFYKSDNVTMSEVLSDPAKNGVDRTWLQWDLLSQSG